MINTDKEPKTYRQNQSHETATWAGKTQEILKELSAFYVEIGDESGKNETFDEAETIKKEGQKAIETGQNAIKVRASKTVNKQIIMGEHDR